MATLDRRLCGLLVGLFISAFAACGTFDRRHNRETDDAAAAMIGKGRDEVIAAWGLPAGVLDLLLVLRVMSGGANRLFRARS
jgi:hypothetical protein